MIQTFEGKYPSIHSQARVADSAVVVGDVEIGAQSSIWYGAVLRGDECSIRVGVGSNLQDNCVVHCDDGCPTVVGDHVTVGHGAILHGCTVEDGSLIGMGAILLNGCVIGAGSLVAAGALVTQNAVVPPGSLVVGSPAKVKRTLSQEEREDHLRSAQTYRKLSASLLPPAGEQERRT